MNAAAPHSQSRFHDLDALRSALMIWGIAVHTSTLAPTWLFRELARVSGYVRMEAFFIISGLLSALLLHKYGTRLTLKKRLPTLLLPLVFGLVVLNPLTNYLIYCFHNEPITLIAFLSGGASEQAIGPIYWHLHLWFLVALLAYVILTPTLSWLVRASTSRWDRKLSESPSWQTFTLLCLLLPLACLGTRAVYELLLEAQVAASLQFTVRSTFYYLPFFALGLWFYRSPWLLAQFSQVRVLHLIIAAAGVGAANWHFQSQPKLVAEAGLLVAESYFAVAFAALLFFLARRFFSAEQQWVRLFSSAAYSIYLFHFLVLYLCAYAFRPWLGSGYPMLLSAAAATLILTLLLHHLAIERVPLLRLLCNGRGRARGSPAQGTPRGTAAQDGLSAKAQPLQTLRP